MRNLKRFALGVALVAVWAGSAMPIMAADSGTVDAQVTAATACILVTPDSLDFGTLPFSNVSQFSDASRSVSYTNCSSASVRVFGRGTDASGSDAGGAFTWGISAPLPGCTGTPPNRYWLNTLKPNERGGDDVVAWLSTSNQELEVIGPSATGTVDKIDLFMPCTGSLGGGSTMTFQIIFTATF
jgi:hypothetical protein